MSNALREEKYKHCAMCQDSPPGPCCWCSGLQQWDVDMGQLSYFTWAKLCTQCVSMLLIRKIAHGACWSVFKDMQYILFFPPQRDQQGQQSLAVLHHSWLLHVLSAIIPPYTPTAELQPPVTYNYSISANLEDLRTEISDNCQRYKCFWTVCLAHCWRIQLWVKAWHRQHECHTLRAMMTHNGKTGQKHVGKSWQ